MKILSLHVDEIEFRPTKKAIKTAREYPLQSTKVTECLAILTSVEKRDESDIHAVVARLVHEIKEIAKQVKATKVVLYPYAHLSSSLASPDTAQMVLDIAEQQLKQSFEVYTAPFGWYKEFTFHCKGHPLAELSREFGPENSAPRSTPLASDEPFTLQQQPLTVDQQINLSTPFLLARAIAVLYPKAQFGSHGFYHEECYLDVHGVSLKNTDIAAIEAKMKEFLNQSLVVEKCDTHGLQQLQQNILKDVSSAQTYRYGDIALVSLFRHADSSSLAKLNAFKITRLGSAYWKNNAQNQQLTRVYCIGFASEKQLTDYLAQQAEAEARSHLTLGKEQGLFIISDLVGPGLPLLAPKGTIIRNEIIQFLWSLHKDKNYVQVWTPHIARELLYKTSGHLDKYPGMFKVQGKTDKFVLKPMNCPHHMQIFDAFPHSYRDMPVRLFEPATVYRDENSGQLHGLTRVRGITQDDGHVFCRPDQIEQEVQLIVGVIQEFYNTIGMTDYWVSLSVRGEDRSQYLGSDEVWQVAENALENVAKRMNLPYKRIPGEAAFYGPKLDFMFKDSLQREWQLSTVQCDFNLPQRFELSYMNEKGTKDRPVVIHRAISGSVERFIGILIEHFAGKFPLWLSPLQIKILTVTDRSLPFAEDVLKLLQSKGIRAELDARSETISKKVRDAQAEKVNYMLTIGDKELDAKTLAVRSRSGKTTFGVSVQQFIDDLENERDTRSQQELVKI